MDTEHRHELKVNELADWIVHVPQFFRENLRWILGGSLILDRGSGFYVRPRHPRQRLRLPA